MDELKGRFVTSVIEPWESLNSAMAEQFAIEPNDPQTIGQATSIALAIKQIAHAGSVGPTDVSAGATDFALISTVADSSRQSLFASATRKTLLSITAQFETDGLGQYAFLRNVINIADQRSGRRDFLEASRQAAAYLIGSLGFDVTWQPEIVAATPNYIDEVVLQQGTFVPKGGTSVNIQFLKRGPAGELAPFSPQSWNLNLKPNPNSVRS